MYMKGDRMKVRLRVMGILLSTVLLVLVVSGCSQPSSPDLGSAGEEGTTTDEGTTDEDVVAIEVDLPEGFPVYPGAVAVSDLSIQGLTNHYNFATPSGTSIEEVRNFFLGELRSLGWYATAVGFSEYISADQANDIYVADPRDENWFLIIVHIGASEYDSDGYAIQFTELSDIPGTVPVSEAISGVENPEGVPIYPGAFLCDYQDYRQQFAGVEHFDYNVEIDYWSGERTERQVIFDEYKEMLVAEGWSIKEVTGLSLVATQGERELRVTLSDWSIGGITLGIRIRITI